MKLPTLVPTLLVAVLLAPAAGGQASLVDDDIRFAENLARYRYFSLAEDVLAGVREGRLDDAQAGNVLLTEAVIRRRASESTADDEKRSKWLGEAIDKLSDWSKTGSAFALHERRPEALEHLVAALGDRGRLRASQAEQDSARADTLRALADKDFAEADAALTQLAKEYELRASQADGLEQTDLAGQYRARAAETFYKRGLNNIDWADVSPEREHRLEQAREALIEFQWALDEEKLSQYYALHLQGVIARKLGDLDEAAAIQAEVLERGQWYWDNITGDPLAMAQVTELFDRAWGEQATMAAAAGNVDAGSAIIAAMRDAHDKGGREYGRVGLTVLLDWAEVLALAGQQGKAGDLIKLVSDRGASLPEGERARDMLATTLSSGSGSLSGGSPAVLMAAARGLYDRREFGEAAFFYLNAAASLASEADRRQHAVEAWTGAGRALSQEKRYLEASLAFEQALDAAVDLGLDAEAQANTAASMYTNLDRRYRVTGHAFDKRLRDAARERLIAMGIGENLVFLQAKEKFVEAGMASPPDLKLYAEAQADFESVPATAADYERALVYTARCLAAAGRHDEALAAFDAMIARSSDATRTPTTTQARATREVALGEALNYKAQLLLDPALGRPAEALELLSGFETLLPSQPGLIESVKYLRISAQAALGDVDAARAALEELRVFRPESGYARLAAFELSQAALKASEAADDPAVQRRLLAEAADAMWTYNELAGFPSYGNLVGCADWYARVGRHDMAARAYAKALEVFDRPSGGASASQLDDTRINYALSLDALKEFGKSRPLWEDLLARGHKDFRVMAGAASCFGGWLEADAEGNVVEVRGSGDFERAYELWVEVHRFAATLRPQKIWWQSKLGAIYARYQSGAANPAHLVEARKVLDSVRLQNPDYDEQTLPDLPPEQSYSPAFKPLFKYLERKVPAR